MNMYVHISLTAVRTTKPTSDNFGQRCGFDVKKVSSDFVKEHIYVYMYAC